MKTYAVLRDEQIRRGIQRIIGNSLSEYTNAGFNPQFWFYVIGNDTMIFHMDHDNAQLAQITLNALIPRIKARFDLQLVAPEISYLIESPYDRFKSEEFIFTSMEDLSFNRALAIAEVDGVDKILTVGISRCPNAYNNRNLNPNNGITCPNDYDIVRVGGFNIYEKPDWDKFVRAFVKAYHTTPLQSFLRQIDGPEDEYSTDEIYEIGTKNIDVSECAYSSVCPNFQRNKGCIKTCKLSSGVRTSVSPKRFREFQYENLIKMTRIH